MQNILIDAAGDSLSGIADCSLRGAPSRCGSGHPTAEGLGRGTGSLALAALPCPDRSESGRPHGQRKQMAPPGDASPAELFTDAGDDLEGCLGGLEVGV